MKERRRPVGRRSDYARMACKPDFVTGLPPPMTIPLGELLPARSSCQPGLPGQDSPGVTPREVPIRHCSRWGLPCRPCCQGRGGLLLHRFTLTTPDAFALRPPRCGGLFLWRYPSGCPARALPGTVALGSPDFPREGQAFNAAVQPSAPSPPIPPDSVRQGTSGQGLCPSWPLANSPRDTSSQMKRL